MEKNEDPPIPPPLPPVKNKEKTTKGISTAETNKTPITPTPKFLNVWLLEPIWKAHIIKTEPINYVLTQVH